MQHLGGHPGTGGPQGGRRAPLGRNLQQRLGDGLQQGAERGGGVRRGVLVGPAPDLVRVVAQLPGDGRRLRKFLPPPPSAVPFHFLGMFFRHHITSQSSKHVGTELNIKTQQAALLAVP